MEAKQIDLFGNVITEKVCTNSRKIFTTIGARNTALGERQKEDYYATHPQSVLALLNLERFSETILEPCVGGGILLQHSFTKAILLSPRIL